MDMNFTLCRAYISRYFNTFSRLLRTIYINIGTKHLFSESTHMDSNSSDYLLNHATLPSVYYQGNKETDANIIDLGLSLRVLQPQIYNPSSHGGYDDLIDWQYLHPQLRNSRAEHPTSILGRYDDEAEGIQSKVCWAYVKVNMDGVIIGRKICILEHSGYSSLASQLEDMFGKQSIGGLRLFEEGSEFSLFYKDRDGQWRTVGDVPWKTFADGVKRLRIVRKDEVFMAKSPALLYSNLSSEEGKERN